MNTALIIVLSIIGLFALFQLFNYKKAKGMEGREAPDTSTVDNGISDPKKVIFFHSPGCSPCKAIMPLVNEVQKEHSNLIVVDVSQNINLARNFKLGGTPSFIAIEEGLIAQVKLGSVDQNWLTQYLT